MPFPSLDFADFIFIDVGPHGLLSVVYFANWLVDTEARFDSGSIPLARWKEIIYFFIRKHIIYFFWRPNWLYGMIPVSSNNSSSKQTGTPISFWNISSHRCSMSTSIIHQWLHNGDILFLPFMKCNNWSLYKENFPISIWFSNGTVCVRKLR